MAKGPRVYYAAGRKWSFVTGTGKLTVQARVNWTFTERVWIGWQRGGKVRVSKVGVDGMAKGWQAWWVRVSLIDS